MFGFFRPVSKFNHYHRFGIPKKTGGERKISAPLPRLKALQRSILDRILAQVPIHDAAHGFVPERSVYTNAIPHVGKSLVVNMDLKDFFPTLTFKRGRMLCSFGVFSKDCHHLGSVVYRSRYG